MPCRYDPSPEEVAAVIKRRQDYIDGKDKEIVQLKVQLNQVSVIADELGDLLQTLWSESDRDGWEHSFQDDVNNAIERQVKHRQDDLDRLSKVWKSGKKLAAVKAANPLHPLKPQLGFDPDDY